MTQGIRPGQIPEWRPGAKFWKPLSDGREITIYPLLAGKARLCVGPLADPNGYDIAYRYTTLDAAVEAANDWNPDVTEEPPDFEAIDFGSNKVHRKELPIHSDAIQVGTKMEITQQIVESYQITEGRVERERTLYKIEGMTEDGKLIEIEAIRATGDPKGNQGGPLVTVTNVTMTSQG